MHQIILQTKAKRTVVLKGEWIMNIIPKVVRITVSIIEIIRLCIRNL